MQYVTYEQISLLLPITSTHCIRKHKQISMGAKDSYADTISILNSKWKVFKQFAMGLIYKF